LLPKVSENLSFALSKLISRLPHLSHIDLASAGPVKDNEVQSKAVAAKKKRMAMGGQLFHCCVFVG